MNRYEMEEKIGEGTFGTVYQAKKKGDPDKVRKQLDPDIWIRLKLFRQCSSQNWSQFFAQYYAVKKLKQQFLSWKDVLIEREFQAMVILMAKRNKKNHEEDTYSEDGHGEWNHSHSHYLVHVHEIVREQDSSLYFVMEYMADGSLHDYISEKSKWKLSRSLEEDSKPNNKYFFDNSEICLILFQAFRGLHHIHSKGLVHRDIKPENILLEGRRVKLADFSLARPISARGNCCPMDRSHCCQMDKGCETSINMFTNYVGTRWYRAPELLCPSSVTAYTGDANANANDENNIDSIHRPVPLFTTAIDVFSMGCIAAELYLCHPLFRGRDEKEQLQLIEKLLLFSKLPLRGNQDVSEKAVKKRLEDAIPTSDSCYISFLYDALHICPERRENTERFLRHAYFKREYKIATNAENYEENSTLTSIIYAQKAYMPGLPESTGTLMTSKKTPIEETRNLPLPTPGTARFKGLPTAKITPTTTDSVLTKVDGSKGFHRLCKVQNRRVFATHGLSPNLSKEMQLDKLVGQPVLGERKGKKDDMIPTPFGRKRQKLRPSQIFNIE